MFSNSYPISMYAEKDKIIANIANWLSENFPLQQELQTLNIPNKNKFLFDVTVYESNSDFMLIRAGFIVELGGSLE